MITHLVLCTPRTNLTAVEEQALAATLTDAIRAIGSVRRFTIGRRIRHGAGYEAAAGAAEFVVLFEFDDFEGLRHYLQHPAHTDLGRHFRESLTDARAYDFDMAGVERIPDFLTKSG